MSEATTDVDPVDEVDQHRMPLIEHLRELRNRLMVSVGALIAGVVIASLAANQIIAFVRAPVDEALAAFDGKVVINAPFEGMYAWLFAALLGGGLLASPVILGQIWGFVAPGLYQTEKRIVMPLTLASTVLFVAGAAFAYEAIFPIAFPFMFSVVQDVEPLLSLQLYLSAVVKMMLAFGVCFQLPVATFFLARMGVVDAKDMLFYFRYAVVGVFILAALLTPPDPLTQTLLAHSPGRAVRRGHRGCRCVLDQTPRRRRRDLLDSPHRQHLCPLRGVRTDQRRARRRCDGLDGRGRSPVDRRPMGSARSGPAAGWLGHCWRHDCRYCRVDGGAGPDSWGRRCGGVARGHVPRPSFCPSS